MNHRSKRWLVIPPLATGMVIASGGLAVMLGVVAATAFDWSWNGHFHSFYFHLYDKGSDVPEVLLQTMLFAVPLLLTFAGVCVIAVGWRANRKVRLPRTMAEHRP